MTLYLDTVRGVFRTLDYGTLLAKWLNTFESLNLFAKRPIISFVQGPKYPFLSGSAPKLALGKRNMIKVYSNNRITSKIFSKYIMSKPYPSVCLYHYFEHIYFNSVLKSTSVHIN